MAFSTLPDESRVAKPFASAAKIGRSASQSRRKFAPLHALDLVGEIGIARSVGLQTA